MESVSEAVKGPESEIVRDGLWSHETRKGRMWLVGDSIVRYVDGEFCKKDKRKRVRSSGCLPGARI